jgi:hypothetical protein
MSGAQGANPPGAFTPTTYETKAADESNPGGNPRYKTDSTEDEGAMPVTMAADHVPNPQEAAGLGGPTFGASNPPPAGKEDEEEKHAEMGLSGTAMGD